MFGAAFDAGDLEQGRVKVDSHDGFVASGAGSNLAGPVDDRGNPRSPFEGGAFAATQGEILREVVVLAVALGQASIV